MKMKWIAPFVLSTILISPAMAQKDTPPQCPDTQATEVPARVEYGGKTETCRLGFRILGIGIGFKAKKCHEYKFIYPAHQECQGESGEGTRCVAQGTLDVRQRRCHCVFAQILDTGLAIPECDCDDDGVAGHVEDAETRNCYAY